MALPFELHREVIRANTARVRDLLRAGVEVNTADRAGYTPLMYALERPAVPVEIVKILLEVGGEVAKGSSAYGEGFNMAAVSLRGGDPAKLSVVLEHGADLHYHHSAGYDALMDASFGRDPRNPRLLEILRILLDRGVVLNGISSYQESALRVFSRVGRFDAVRLLLDAGADEGQLAWTPLHRAVALGTLADVKALVEAGEWLEPLDWWERTPWLVAVRTGDLQKAQYLAESGADFTVTGRGGASPLDFAVEGFHTPMLKWLIDLGINVESTPECCITPLMAAVQADNAEAVDVLIAAGANVDRRTPCGSALRSVDSREIALRLLGAGADPGELSSSGRRAILGLDPEPHEWLFDATPEDFRIAPGACWGDHNPELMDQPFWQAMIHSGLNAYAGGRLVGATSDDSPVWCADRFGQSLTMLPDGRAIQIGGEHEDFYDSDFCIYNDVFVHHPDGKIDIYCYPEEVFPPTDFHTATLIGDTIYIIGGLGYQGSRRFGETPVYRLDTHTLQIAPVETTGELPGWISRHRATLTGTNEIRIWGGKLANESGGNETYEDNNGAWILDTASRVWRGIKCAT